MASGKEQKEQAQSVQARRSRRLRMLGGTLVFAVAVVAVAIAISSGGSSTPDVALPRGAPTCKNSTDSAICGLLAGIPEHGNTLGSPAAKVTVTEYGDLECPVCRDFALGVENQLISKDVRSGKVKLVYKSLETATGGSPDPGIFDPQQAAAYAAGLQGKAWYYIEFFYHYQGAEDSGYVNQKYLSDLARHVPNLNVGKWLSDSHEQSLLTQVHTENNTSISHLQQIGATSQGQVTTPTLTIVGPKGQAQPVVGVPNDYSGLESEINSVL